MFGMANEDFMVREKNVWIIASIVLLAVFGAVLSVWAIFFPRDGQRMIVYVGGIIIWSIAVLMGLASILESWLKRFGMANGVLYYCNGLMKTKKAFIEEVAKVVIIQRKGPYGTKIQNPIAYEVELLGKEGQTLLWFYDPTGMYVFNEKFMNVIHNHRIELERKGF